MNEKLFLERAACPVKSVMVFQDKFWDVGESDLLELGSFRFYVVR